MKRIVKESYEVSPELEQRLNSILADEFLAAEFYRLAELAMKGKKQHLLSEIAEENGKDELDDHFKNLSEWMQSKGIRVVTNHDEMLDITNGSVFTVEDGDSTEDIVDKLTQSEEEAIEEADFVLKKIAEYGAENITLPLVIDTELYEPKQTARGNLLTREQRTKCIVAFCERVKAAGYTPMVYSSLRWSIMRYDRDAVADYPFWFAYYGERSSYRFDYAIWQYTSEGSVPGITGEVDLDMMLDYSVIKK